MKGNLTNFSFVKQNIELIRTRVCVRVRARACVCNESRRKYRKQYGCGQGFSLNFDLEGLGDKIYFQ